MTAPLIPFECQTCRTTFHRTTPGRGRTYKYCSRRCASQARVTAPLVYSCERCGDTFMRRSNGTMYRFCSTTCGHPSSRKQHCKNGHEFTPENTMKRENGNRRCRACYRAAQHRYQQNPAVEIKEMQWRKTHIQRQIERLHRLNEETRSHAHRHGYQWTGPELEIASRTDLSSQTVSVMTGRTLRAVQSMRDRLRHEPKLQQLAGV